jgi:hypothetical protein
MSMTEQEADAYCNGGETALLEYWAKGEDLFVPKGVDCWGLIEAKYNQGR